MSNLKVHIATENQYALWDEFVDNSNGGTIFHKVAWLKAAEKESKTKLIPLVCLKGNEIVGILPLFIKKIFFFNIILSPPKGCNIARLGPVIRTVYGNNYKNDSLSKKVITEFIDFIDITFTYSLIKLTLNLSLTDIRPFIWACFKYNIYYTYSVDLTKNADDIFSSFEGGVRTKIRKIQKPNNCKIINGKLDNLTHSMKQMRNRYLEKGMSYGASSNYYIDIYNNFRNNISIKTIVDKNQPVTSLVFVHYKNCVFHWIGGINSNEFNAGVNELIQWETIKSFSGTTFKYYDMMGANTKSISHFKSQFGPELVSYYDVFKSNFLGKLILLLVEKPIYRWLTNIFKI